MKRKKADSSATTDLRSFLQKSAAKKKQLHPDIVIPSTNESQMQLVVFQGQSDIGTSTVPPQPVKDEQRQSGEPPKTEDDESMPPAQSDSSSSDSDEDNNDDYEIEHDPGLRIPISSYPVNARASVRRALIVMGPCRPKMKREDFPQHKCGGMCRFNLKWFDEFKWIEYSVHRDAAYCFICYLFKDSGDVGGDAFVDGGFRNWHMKARIRKHVGAIDSYHNEAEEKYNRFIMPKTSIRESIASNSEQIKERYRARLTWSLKCIRFLLRQGLAFRGHDEKKDSLNRGNFRELLAWLAGNFEEVNQVVLENAPQNCQLIDHKIQKQLIAACAHETTKFIIEELGDECFAILTDESSDAYLQEQLAVCLRYVNKKGEPVERFFGLDHVEDTTALMLKEAIQSLLMKYQLPLSKVRGQGYDGASNMKGHANGLKKLIMDESPSAYYVHCFAHQLQLTLVAVAKENTDCDWFFGQLSYLLSVLGMSCKKIRMFRVAQAEYMIEALRLGEIETGQGLNQEMGLARPGDTLWGSHYKTVMHVMYLYPSIRKVLFRIGNESKGAEANGAQTMLTVFKSFEFVFLLHLMNEIFGYTNDLCIALVSFSPAKLFAAFNAENLIKLAKFYPRDFDVEEMNQLPFQLNRYINEVRNDDNFKNLRSLTELSMMLVEKDKVSRYDIVYKLLKLVLLLPVATAGVERIFSIMNFVKNKLRSKMGQKYLNGCLVTFIEREFFLKTKDQDIITYFQAIKDRKVNL